MTPAQIPAEVTKGTIAARAKLSMLAREARTDRATMRRASAVEWILTASDTGRTPFELTNHAQESYDMLFTWLGLLKRSLELPTVSGHPERVVEVRSRIEALTWATKTAKNLCAALVDPQRENR